jgi:RNA polymerase sigma-70 factor (ECF subfamily)
MSDDDQFHDFLAKVRAGDARAAEELVKKYEWEVRAAIKRRLSNQALRQQFDSVDICQSVLGSFFVRAAAGQFDLDDPAQLVALLKRMAQNKFLTKVRHHHRQRRDARRGVAAADGEYTEAVDDSPSPERQAVGRETLEALLNRLSPEERALAHCRAEGKSWEEIAEELGGTAQARRKQLARALNRVAPEVGIEPRRSRSPSGDQE